MTNAIQIKASDLQVGDVFASSGHVVTSVEPYTTVGYGLDFVCVADTGLKTCMAAHFPAGCNLFIRARAA